MDPELQTISIAEDPAPSETIPIAPDKPETERSVPFPETVINSRTSRYSFALGTSKSYADVWNAVANGNEDSLRAEVATNLTEQNRLNANNYIVALAQQRKGPLTTAEMDQIKNAVNFSNQWIDPKSVLEGVYSGRLYDMVYGIPTKFGSWWEDAKQKAPQEVETAELVGRDWTTKQLYIHQALEKVQAIYDDQSYLSFAGDIAKDVFTLGLYGEYKSRNVIPDTGFFTGGLLGSHKEQERLNLYRLPMASFTKAVDGIVEMAKDNPHLALGLLSDFFNNLDVDRANIYSAVTLVSVPGIPTLGKKLLTGTLFQNVSKAPLSIKPAKVAALESVGDIEEAAVTAALPKIAKQTVDPVKVTATNPITDAVEGLTSNLTIQRKAVEEGPGSRELVNRIVESYDSMWDKFNSMVTNLQRGVRIPALLATEDGIRALKDLAKDRYIGIASRVLDVDIRDNKYGNFFFWKYQIGRHDGTLFESIDEARAVARLEGISLRGDINIPRQDELNRLIVRTENDLKLARIAKNPTPEQRAFLDLEGQKLIDITKGEAQLAAYRKELDQLKAMPGATIEPQGKGFYLQKYVGVTETDKAIRDRLLSTPESQAPTGLRRAITGWFRTGEETLSKDQMDMAKIALYGQNNLLALVQTELQEIRKLSRFTLPGTQKKQAWLDFESTLKFSRDQGKFFDTVGDVQDHYLRFFNRPATDREVSAYFAWKRANEMERMFYDMRLYMEESRQGAENFIVRTLDANDNWVGSNMFKGIAVKELPKDLNEGVLFVKGKFDQMEMRMGGKWTDELIEKVNTGRLRVVKVLYPNDNPLAGFGRVEKDHRIAYVVSEKLDSSPLTFSRTQRTPGMYDLDYPWYIKQANITKDALSETFRYIGDKTLMPMVNGQMGKDILKIIEEARSKMAAGNYAEAKTIASKLPIGWNKFAAMFNETIGPDGKIVPAVFNVNEPFHLVSKDQTIGMQPGLGLRDRINAMDFNGKVNRFRDDTVGNTIYKNVIKDERDVYELYTIRNEGTRLNPIYKYEPADYVDPIPSLNRALRSMVDSLFMQDYKIFAAEHWVEQAKQYLRGVENPEQARAAPFFYFHHGEWKTDTPLEIRYRLDDARMKAKQIWNTPSKLDNFLTVTTQAMADSVYSSGKVGKALQILPYYALANTKDAAAFIRSATFNATIGLFAIPQLFVQQMTYATIAGVSGFGRAGAGTMGAFFSGLAGLNPRMIDALDRLASKINVFPSISNKQMSRWRPGELKEAWELYQSTGFQHVGKGHIMMDEALTPRVIKSAGQQFLDWGALPFVMGEKSVRAGAWYTAYREFRDVNPAITIGRKEIREIFARADLLSGNMSAASKSLLQRGPGSFTTQFMGYNMRLVELMTGSRLDTTTKLRLFSTYAALFGVSALGLSGLPAGDYVRQKAIEHGYDHEKADMWKRWVVEGLPSELIYMASSQRYNIGQRYSDPSFAPIRDALQGDKATWTLLGGAPANALTNLWTFGDGFRKSMYAMMTGDTSQHPMTVDDILQPTKVVSSANATIRLAEALRTGNWLTRKGDVLEKGISGIDAAFMTVSGLQHQSAADVQAMFAVEKAWREEHKKTEASFMEDGRRYIRAVADNDSNAADVYWKRMYGVLIKNGYPIEKYGELMARLEKANIPLIDREKFNLYWGRQRPMDRREQLLETGKQIMNKGQQ